MADETPTFESLRMSGGSRAFRRGHLDPQLLAIHPAGHDHEGPLVWILRTPDLEALLRCVPGTVIRDRGKRHDAKQLSAYLVGHAGGQAIRADYRSAGRAAQGIRVLLASASRHRARSTFFVGVSGPVFDDLSARAEPDVPPAAPGDDPSAQLRSLVSDGIDVPESLRHEFIGDDLKMEWVRRCIVMIAQFDYPVLIQGESGTGKEVVAWQIHRLGGRKLEGFIPVNCGGIPSDLLESELFGHVKGSFTGATRDKKGLWTLATEGTLFLDEIGELEPRHQVKVLRALDDKGAYRPVGGDGQIRSGARIIAATNRDLTDMVRKGDFREDLYYRLFHFRIRTPALREHPADIPLLARHFWVKIHKDSVHPLPDTVTDALAHFPWPGNARELRAFLANLSVVARGRKVDMPLVRAVMRERLGPALSKGKDS